VKKWKNALLTAVAGGAGMAVVGTIAGLLTNMLTGGRAALTDSGGGWATYLFALLGSHAYAGFVWGLFYPRFAAQTKNWAVHGALFGLGLFLAGLLPGVILVDITLGLGGALISTWGISSLSAALGGGLVTAYVYHILTQEKANMDILMGKGSNQGEPQP
jgi:hypothetical protein